MAADLARRVARQKQRVRGGAPAGREPPQLERLGEVERLRTEHSTTFRLSDGTFETELSTTPVHYDDGSATLQPVDTTLRRLGGAAGGWRMDRSRARLELPQRLADGPVVISTRGTTACRSHCATPPPGPPR